MKNYVISNFKKIVRKCLFTLLFVFFGVCLNYQSVEAGSVTTDIIYLTADASGGLMSANYYYPYVCVINTMEPCIYYDDVSNANRWWPNDKHEFKIHRSGSKLTKIEFRAYSEGFIGIGKGWSDWYTWSDANLADTLAKQIDPNYSTNGIRIGVAIDSNLSIPPSGMGTDYYSPGGFYDMGSASADYVDLTPGYFSGPSISVSAVTTPSSKIKEHKFKATASGDGVNTYYTWTTSSSNSSSCSSLTKFTTGTDVSSKSASGGTSFNGTYYVHTCAVDKWGNVARSSQYFNFDNVAPGSSQFTVTPSSNTGWLPNSGIKITAKDESTGNSGINMVKYCFDVSSCNPMDSTYSFTGTEAVITLPSDLQSFEGYIYVGAIDNAGNVSTSFYKTGKLHIDASEPIVNLMAMSYTKEEVEFEFQIYDAESSIDKTRFRVKDASGAVHRDFDDFDRFITLKKQNYTDGDYVLELEITDAAGNVSIHEHSFTLSSVVSEVKAKHNNCNTQRCFSKETSYHILTLYWTPGKVKKLEYYWKNIKSGVETSIQYLNDVSASPSKTIDGGTYQYTEISLSLSTAGPGIFVLYVSSDDGMGIVSPYSSSGIECGVDNIELVLDKVNDISVTTSDGYSHTGEYSAANGKTYPAVNSSMIIETSIVVTDDNLRASLPTNEDEKITITFTGGSCTYSVIDYKISGGTKATIKFRFTNCTLSNPVEPYGLLQAHVDANSLTDIAGNGLDSSPALFGDGIAVDNFTDTPTFTLGDPDKTVYTTGDKITFNVTYPYGFIQQAPAIGAVSYPSLSVQFGENDPIVLTNAIKTSSGTLQYSLTIDNAMVGGLTIVGLTYDYENSRTQIVDMAGNAFDGSQPSTSVGGLQTNNSSFEIKNASAKVYFNGYTTEYTVGNSGSTVKMSSNLNLRLTLTFSVYFGKSGSAQTAYTLNGSKLKIGGTSLTSCSAGNIVSASTPDENNFAVVVQELDCGKLSGVTSGKLSVEPGFIDNEPISSLTNTGNSDLGITFDINNSSDSPFSSNYNGANGTASITIPTKDYYSTSGSKLSGCSLLNYGNCEIREGKIVLRGLSEGTTTISLVPAYNIYGVQTMTSFTVGTVDSSSITVSAALKGSPDYQRLIGGGGTDVTTYYYYIEHNTLGHLVNTSLAIPLNFSIAYKSGVTDKVVSISRTLSSSTYVAEYSEEQLFSFEVYLDNEADKSITYGDVIEADNTKGSIRELTYVITFKSGIVKTITVSIVKYNSANVDLVLESVAGCSKFSSGKCSLTNIYGSNISLNIGIKDNNENAVYTTSLINSADDLLNDGGSSKLSATPTTDLGVTTVGGTVNGTIKGGFTAEALLDNVSFINVATKLFTVTYTGLETITGYAINRDVSLTLVNTGPVYIPLKTSNLSGDIYEDVSCGIDDVCNVLIGNDAIPDPAYFKVVRGENAGTLSTQAVQYNQVAGQFYVQFPEVMFVYKSDNRIPEIKSVSEPKNYNCSAPLPDNKLIIGDSLCYEIVVNDDDKTGIQLTKRLIVVDEKIFTVVSFDLKSTTSDKNEDGWYEHTIHLVIKYLKDSDNKTAYSYDGSIELPEGTIVDGYKFSTFRKVIEVKNLNLVPNALNLIDTKFEGAGYASVYFKEYYVIVTFNKELNNISSLEVYTKDGGTPKKFECEKVNDNKSIKCTKNSQYNVEGEHVVYVKGTVTDVEGVTWTTTERELGKVIYDVTGPTITINADNTSSGEFDTKHGFQLGFNISDNYSGLKASTVNAPVVKVGGAECTNVTIELYNGAYVVKVGGCPKSGAITAKFSNYIKDNLGNEYSSEDIEFDSDSLQVTTGDMQLVSGYPKYTAGYLQAKGRATIEFKFTKEIVELDGSLIEVTTNNAIVVSKEKSGDTLIVVIEAKIGASGSISLLIDKGAVRYVNESKTVEYVYGRKVFDLDLQIVTGEYSLSYTGISAPKCTGYYCNADDEITIEFVASRDIVENTVSPSNIVFTVGGVARTAVNAVVSGKTVTFTYKVLPTDKGNLGYSTLTINDKDRAGNGGMLENAHALKTDLMNYRLSSVAADFNGETISHKVNVGSSFNELKKYLMDAYDVAGMSVEIEGYDTTKLVNNDLFAEIAKYEGANAIKFVAEDEAGNKATLYINLTIGLGEKIGVEFISKTHIFDGAEYSFDANNDVKITLPSELDKMDKIYKNGDFARLIKSKITAKVIDVTNKNAANVGSYVITTDQTKISLVAADNSYLIGDFDIIVTNGKYTVVKSALDISKCTLPDITAVYSGGTNYSSNHVFMCDGVKLVGGLVTLSQADVGNTTYMVSNIYVHRDFANDYSISGATMLVGNARINPKEIDLSDFLIEQISKYYDGKTDVSVQKGTYRGHQVYNGETLEIVWTSGEYVLAAEWESGEQVVKLAGAQITSSINYVLKETAGFVYAKGTLLKDDAIDVTLEYYFGEETYKTTPYAQGETIYSNKPITFKVKEYKGALAGAANASELYTHTWKICDTKINDFENLNFAGCDNGAAEAAYRYSTVGMRYIYLVVTDPSGVYVVKEVLADFNNTKLQLTGAYLSEYVAGGEYAPLAKGTYEYKINNMIVIVLEFNRNVVAAGDGITLNGQYATYDKFYSIQIDRNKVIFAYVVEASAETDKNLVITKDSLVLLQSSTVDIYGNNYEYAMDDEKFDVENGNTYIVNIDRAPATIEKIEFNTNGTAQLVNGSTYYVSTNTATGRTLTMTIKFTEKQIKDYPATIYVGDEYGSTIPLTCSIGEGADKNELVCTKVLQSSDLNGREGVLLIKQVSSKRMSFEDRTIELFPSEMESYVTKRIYVDNKDFTINLEGPTKVKDTAAIRYECNKTEVACSLSYSDLEIKYNNVDVAASNVVIDGNVITISNLGADPKSGTLTVRVNSNKKDYVGNSVKHAQLLSIDVDNIPLKATNIVVEKQEDRLYAVVRFNKEIAKLDQNVTIGTNVPGVVFTYYTSLTNKNELKFIYTIDISDFDGEISFTEFSNREFYDEMNNQLESVSLVGVPVSGSGDIDTKAPILDETIVSEAVNCNAGVCNSNGSVKVKLTFNELIQEYDGINIETNFGKFTHVMNAQAKATTIEFIIDIDDSYKTTLSKFVILKLAGNFYDANGNKLAYSAENVHENSNIKLDATSPSIEAIVVESGVADNLFGENYYFKAGDVITITVKFNDVVANLKDANVVYPTLGIAFDAAYRGSLTVAASEDMKQLIYTYVVSPNDKGQLSSITLTGGNLVDSANNKVDITIPTYDKNIIVDNEDLVINMVNVQEGATSVIKYYCNKNYVECALTSHMIKVYKNSQGNNQELTTVNIVVGKDADGFDIITISGLTGISASEAIIVKIAQNQIRDYTGKGNLPAEIQLGVDSAKVEILYSAGIEVRPHNLINDCVNGICKKDDVIIFKVTFNKNISTYDNTMFMTIDIGGKSYKADFSMLNKNFIEFTYTVGSGVNGQIRMLQISGSKEVLLSDAATIPNTSDKVIYIKEGYQLVSTLEIDTAAPKLLTKDGHYYIESSAPKCVNGICMNGHKVILAMHFDEEIHSRKEVKIWTNFGYYEFYTSTNVYDSVVYIELVVDKNNASEDKFVVNKLEGKFFDMNSNETAISLDEVIDGGDTIYVHENDDIGLDTMAPTIVDVEVSGCIESNGKYYCKENDEINVVVTFSEALLNTEVAKNRAKLTLTFDNPGRGNVTSEVSADKKSITYSYHVSNYDAGALRDLEFAGGYLTDGVGNAVDLLIREELVFNIVVDNVKPQIATVELKKNDVIVPIKTNAYVNKNDELKLSVTYSEDITGKPGLVVTNSGKVLQTVVGTIISSRIIEYVYNVGEEEGEIAFVLEGKVLDVAHNESDEVYEYNQNKIYVVNSSFNLIANRVKDTLSPSDVKTGKVLIYTIENSNEITFDYTYNQLKSNALKLKCGNEGIYSDLCYINGFPLEEIPLTLTVEKAEGRYNVYWMTSGIDLTFKHRFEFELNYVGNKLLDIAGNEINVEFEDENDRFISFDNLDRVVSSFEFTTDKQYSGKYFITSDATVSVSVTFNAPLVNGLGKNERYPLVVKLNNNVIIYTVTTDGLTYTGQAKVMNAHNLCKNNTGECVVPVKIESRDSALSRAISTVKGSNNESYTIEEIVDSGLYVDLLPPVVEMTHSYVRDIVKDKIVISLSCVDNANSIYASKCKEMYAKINTDHFVDKGNGLFEFDISSITDDEIEISYGAIDFIGNLYNANHIFKVDREAPTITIIDDHINEPIVSRNNYVEVRAADSMSGLATNASVCYKWLANGIDDGLPCKEVILVSGSVRIAVPAFDGKYNLVVTGVKDALGNTNSNLIESKEIVIDNTAPVVKNVEIIGDKCVEANGKIYCGKNNSENAILKVRVELEDYSKINSYRIESLQFDVIQTHLDGNVLTFGLWVKSNVVKSADAMNISLTVGDVLNFSATHEISLENVMIDVEDNTEITFALDNDKRKKGTKIETLEINDNGKAPIGDITCKIFDKNGSEKECDLATIVGTAFEENAKLVVYYGDTVGNSGSREFVINIDSEIPTIMYELKDKTMNAYIDNRGTARVFNKELQLNIKNISEKMKYSVVYCDETYENCVAKYESGDYINTVENPVINMLLVNDIEYIKIMLEDEATNTNEYKFAVEVMHPEVEFDGETWKNDHTVEVKNSEGYTKITYRVSKGMQTSAVMPMINGKTIIDGSSFDYNGEYNVIVTVYITENHYKELDPITLKFDNEILASNFVIEMYEGTEKYDGGWTNKNIVFKVYEKEEDSTELSGLNRVYIGANECILSGSEYQCTINEAGEYTVSIEDNSGNTVRVNDNIVLIDKEGYKVSLSAISPAYEKKHSVSFAIDGVAGAPFDKSLWMLLPRSIGKQNITVEEFMGVYNLYVFEHLNGSSENPTRLSLVVGNEEQNGLYDLFVYTVDKAGNEELLKTVLNFDNEGPEITVDLADTYARYEIDSDGDLYDVTNNRKVVAFEDKYVDNGAAANIVKSYKFLKDGKEVPMSSLQGEYVLVVTAVDSLGNESVNELNIILADNSGPTIELSNKGTNSNPAFTITDISDVDWANSEYCVYTLTICEEELEPIKTHDGDIFRVILEDTALIGNIGIRVRARDMLGNVKDQNFDLYYDNDAPEINIVNVRDTQSEPLTFDDTNPLYTIITDYTNGHIYVDISIYDYGFSSNTGKLKACFAQGILENGTAFDSNCVIEISKPLTKDEATNTYRITYLVRRTGYLNIYVEDLVGNYKIKRVYVDNISLSTTDFDLVVDNAPSAEKNIDIVVNGNEDDIVSITYKEFDYSTKYSNAANLYRDSANEEFNVNIAELVIKNVENKLYVVKVVNKWGNASYKAVRINTLDKDAPEFNEGKDFEISINGGTLLQETIKDFAVIGYEKVVGNKAANANRFIYNQGEVRLVFPAASVYEPILTGYGVGQKVFVEVCYNTACASLVDISVDKNGNLIGSAKSLQELFAVETLTGTITYQLRDEAGNTGEIRSFYIERYEEAKSKIRTEVTASGKSWFNKYDVKYVAEENGLLIDKVEYFFEDEKGKYCTTALEEGVVQNIACANLDGLYTLKYKLYDLLGYVKEVVASVDGSPLNNVPLDTILPVNNRVTAGNAAIVDFGMHKDGENYYLTYDVLVENAIEENAVIEIMYNDSTKYCEIVDAYKIQSGRCDIISSSKFTSGVFNFKTKAIDKAGNVSVNVLDYSLEYNESRSVTVGRANYSADDKTISVDIIVNNPYNGVNKFVVKVEQGENVWVESSALAAAITGVNNRYTLSIKVTNFPELFNEGIINKRLQIIAFDNYKVNEGLPLGQIGQPIVVDVNYDTTDPEIEINVTNVIIKTNDQNNVFNFNVNNKNVDEIKVQYIIQRTTNVSNLTTITKTNFVTEYLDCKYCASSGKVTGNEITLAQDANLETGVYRLVVYVEDKYGNRQISTKTINIDNTKPVINIVNYANIDSYTPRGDYKVYKEIVKVSANDGSYTAPYRSGVKSFTIKNLVTQVETPIDLTLDFVTIGGRGANFNDGEYEIIVKDIAGNIRTQKVIVDTENNGFAIISRDGTDTDDKTFNLEGLDNLYIKLYEEASYLRLEYRVGNAKKLVFEVDEENCKYTIDGKETRMCASNWRDVFKLAIDEEIELSKVLGLTSGYTLNTNINQLYIKAENISGIAKETQILLDFNAPVIVVKSSLMGTPLTVLEEISIPENGFHVECVDDYNRVLFDCKKMDTKVITTSTNDYANSIKDIVSSYVKTVDGKNYQSIIAENDRLIVNYFKVDKPNDIKKIHTSDNDWHYLTYILKTVGEYVLEYTYTDAAGNAAKPAYLVLNVIDTDGPTVVNVNNIKTTMNLYINGDEGSSYTVLGIKAKDDYGFNKEGTEKEIDIDKFYLQMLNKDGTKTRIEFVQEDRTYVGRVDGIKYVTMNRNMRGEVIYTFIKQAQYQVIYEVYDYVGNAPKNIFKVSVDVFDKHAPTITDPNEINIVNDNQITIDGVNYTIQEDANKMWLEDANKVAIEIKNNIFAIGTAKYYLDVDNHKVRHVLNVNEAKVCFNYGENCGLNLLDATAFDTEDEAGTEISLSKVEFSRDGNVYAVSKNYRADTKDELFKLGNIEFDYVGYYKVTLFTVDSNNNRNEIVYVFVVEDTDAAVFMMNGIPVADKTIVEKDYDEEFANAIKGNTYPGTTEEQKIENYIRAWIRDSITVDHNYEADNSMPFTIEEVRLLDTLNGQEYLKYAIVLRAEDSSNNVAILNLEYRIIDKDAPVNGDIEISFNGQDVAEVSGFEVDTNAETIYFRLTNGTDITDKVSYEYKVLKNGIEPSDWSVYDEEFELAYTSVTNETVKIQIMYRSKDKVGNTPDKNAASPVFRVDRRNPVMTVEKVLDDTVEGIETGSVGQYDGKVRVTFRDDKGAINVVAYRNNKKIRDTVYTSDETTTVEGFGHYLFKATDPAGNSVIHEFILLPGNNTFSVIDNQLLHDAENAGEETMKFDMVILQKLAPDGNSFYFEDMSLIGENDHVYLMSIVPDREGSIFSVYASGAVTGDVFRQYDTYFPINISNNITNINPDLTLNDYIINFQGERYILIGVEQDAYEGPTKPTKPGGSESSGSFTWVFYILGGVGAVGGVFLIMKLRKRVRAA